MAGGPGGGGTRRARGARRPHAPPCFYARRALELGVSWAYKRDAALEELAIQRRSTRKPLAAGEINQAILGPIAGLRSSQPANW